MKVSLVMATVGRSDDVGRFIRAAAAQTARNFELIVVDQNSDDRLVPFIEEGRALGLDLQHLRMDRPSLSGARNLGISRASGEVVALPDDDCWYEPQVIEAVTAAFAAQPQWGALCADWVEQSAARGGFATAPLSLAAWRRFRGGDASSISLFVRRDLLQRLGGFDERLGVGQWFGAGEEIDFVLKALAAGTAIGRCPGARMHHHHDPQKIDGAQADWRALQRRARGTGALYVKHRLPAPVVVRGLLAPPLKALWHWRGINAFKCGLAMSLGRTQGALKWLMTQR